VTATISDGHTVSDDHTSSDGHTISDGHTMSTKGHGDATIVLLMQAIERVAKEEEYIQRKVRRSVRASVEWRCLTQPVFCCMQPCRYRMRGCDCWTIETRKQTDPFLSWSAMLEVGSGCRMPSRPDMTLSHELQYVLLYLNELGAVTWFDEDGLRKLVILVS
jgi:hypothetical protein